MQSIYITEGGIFPGHRYMAYYRQVFNVHSAWEGHPMHSLTLVPLGGGGGGGKDPLPPLCSLWLFAGGNGGKGT